MKVKNMTSLGRLRSAHWQCDPLLGCIAPRRKALAPCDVIAALDVLQDRIDTAAVLIQQVMNGWQSTHDVNICPHCAPYRNWLNAAVEATR